MRQQPALRSQLGLSPTGPGSLTKYRRKAYKAYGMIAQQFGMKTVVFFGPTAVNNQPEAKPIAIIPVTPDNLGKALEINRRAGGFIVHEPLNNEALSLFSKIGLLNYSASVSYEDHENNAAKLKAVFNLASHGGSAETIAALDTVKTEHAQVRPTGPKRRNLIDDLIVAPFLVSSSAFEL